MQTCLWICIRFFTYIPHIFPENSDACRCSDIFVLYINFSHFHYLFLLIELFPTFYGVS